MEFFAAKTCHWHVFNAATILALAGKIGNANTKKHLIQSDEVLFCEVMGKREEAWKRLITTRLETQWQI